MGVELTILVLLIVGLAFMVLEAIVPAFGLFGVGGALSFFAALFMLRNVETFYGIAVDVPLIAALGVIGVVVLAGSLYFILTAWRQKISAGAETMQGASARVVEWRDGTGRVHIDGETWSANGPAVLQPGDAVTVAARNHLVLTVTKDASQ